MFTLDQSPTYWFVVPVEMTDENGRRRKFDFDAEFNRLPRSEITELLRTREEGESPLKDADVVERVFVGWRRINDANGNELVVNAANRAALLDTHPVEASIVRAYLKSLGIEGAAKN